MVNPQPDVRVNIDPGVFNDVYVPYLNEFARTQIYYGGSASGKSVFLAQRTVVDVMNGGRNYLIVRQVGRTIRGSVFAEILRVIYGWNVQQLFNINKSDMLITCQNGYQIIFAGLDDTEKLKSLVPAKGAITDIWVEEATETDRNSLKQLYKRQRGGDPNIPKRLTLSFNPVFLSNYIYQEYFSKIGWADSQKEYKSDDLAILKTTYKNNRFLTADDVRDLVNETDKYYRDVYTYGNWGVLGHVIFSRDKWSVQDLSGMHDQFTNRKNGLDFGFSSDPAAASSTHYDKMRKTIYIFKELYELGLTNDKLAEKLKEMIGYWRFDKIKNEMVCYKTERIVCDSAEPKSVAELQLYGVDAVGARKGKDSVMFGIQWLQQQTIIIDISCINTRNEIEQYHWKEDAAGNAIRQPVDKNDHIISELRYAYEGEMGGTLDVF